MSFVNFYKILRVSPSFPFGIEGGMLGVFVLIPDHCLSIYFSVLLNLSKNYRYGVCMIHCPTIYFKSGKISMTLKLNIKAPRL